MTTLVIVTKKGKIIRFSADEIRKQARAGRGLLGMRLDEGDEVVGIATVE